MGICIVSHPKTPEKPTWKNKPPEIFFAASLGPWCCQPPPCTFEKGDVLEKKYGEFFLISRSFNTKRLKPSTYFKNFMVVVAGYLPPKTKDPGNHQGW